MEVQTEANQPTQQLPATLSAAELIDLFVYDEKTVSGYYDRRSRLTLEEYQARLQLSSTLYIGDLSFYTREEVLQTLCEKFGPVLLFKMGANRYLPEKKGGFAFVQFFTRQQAAECKAYLNGKKLDGKTLKVDWDAGFRAGRQFGRGKETGCQVRDEQRVSRSSEEDACEPVEDRERPIPKKDELDSSVVLQRRRSRESAESADGDAEAKPEVSKDEWAEPAKTAQE